MSLRRLTSATKRRIPTRVLPAASVGASVIVHAALLMLGAIVVYEATTLDAGLRPDAIVNFDAPGQSTSIPAPSTGFVRGEVALLPADQSASQTQVPPTLAPLLTGLSSPSIAPTDAARASSAQDLERMFDASRAGPGATDGIAGGEAVTFAGLGASSARSVVYAVDCSGPMVTTLPLVLAEVRRSVSRLSPTQKFGVILFRRNGDAPVVETFAPVLVRATPTARDRLDQWLSSAEPSGRSSPLAGLEAAISLHPDAVFLLSRSIDRSGGAVWDGGLNATMARLDQLNPRDISGRRPIVIQTIQFLDEDPTGTLQAIGTQHGTGKSGYRVIRRSEDLSSR